MHPLPHEHVLIALDAHMALGVGVAGFLVERDHVRREHGVAIPDHHPVAEEEGLPFGPRRRGVFRERFNHPFRPRFLGGTGEREAARGQEGKKSTQLHHRRGEITRSP